MTVSSNKKLKFFSVLLGLLVFSSFGLLAPFVQNFIYLPGIHASLFFDTFYGESFLSLAEISVPIMAGIFWGFLSYVLLKILYRDVLDGNIKNLIARTIKWYLVVTLLGYVLIFLGSALFAQLLF